MQELDLETLRKIEIGILKDIDLFCKTNNIKYWLDKGTLLGAVRHQGFIPWDDDIDVGMLRSDYETFVKLYKDRGKYRLVTVHNEPMLFCAYGKVVDKSTVLIEDNRYVLSVNVDINIYDNAPDNDCIKQSMFKKRNKLRKYCALRNSKTIDSVGKVDFLIKFIRKKILLLFPCDYFQKEMIRNSTRFSKQNTKEVANFLEYGSCSVDREVFASTQFVLFENEMFPVPIGFDNLLREYYGDYMKLPPKEKQITHHNFYAYFRDDDLINQNKELIILNYLKQNNTSR